MAAATRVVCAPLLESDRYRRKKEVKGPACTPFSSVIGSSPWHTIQIQFSVKSGNNEDTKAWLVMGASTASHNKSISNVNGGEVHNVATLLSLNTVCEKVLPRDKKKYYRVASCGASALAHKASASHL